jgi:hypothetical protein
MQASRSSLHAAPITFESKFIYENTDENEVENEGVSHLSRGEWKQIRKIELCILVITKKRYS